MIKDLTLNKKSDFHKIIFILISMAVVFAIIIILQNRKIPNTINMVTVLGRMYEIIPYREQSEYLCKTKNDILKKHELQYPINKEDIGDKIGVFPADYGIYNVFDYKPINGQSILIVQKGEELQFALFCNLSDNNTITIGDLLNLYGFNIDLATIKVNVEDRKLPNAGIDFYKELYRSMVIGSYVDTDNLENIKITIKGGNSDVLTICYYPNKKMLNCALTYYQISDELFSMLIQ